MEQSAEVDKIKSLLKLMLLRMKASHRIYKQLALEIKHLPEVDKREVQRLRNEIIEEVSEISDLIEELDALR